MERHRRVLQLCCFSDCEGANAHCENVRVSEEAPRKQLIGAAYPQRRWRRHSGRRPPSRRRVKFRNVSGGCGGEACRSDSSGVVVEGRKRAVNKTTVCRKARNRNTIGGEEVCAWSQDSAMSRCRKATSRGPVLLEVSRRVGSFGNVDGDVEVGVEDCECQLTGRLELARPLTFVLGKWIRGPQRAPHSAPRRPRQRGVHLGGLEPQCGLLLHQPHLSTWGFLVDD